ncbi:hypothetical protein Cgig2_023912 [Carnegiea gigantea]|uniref:Uncharacterized protein n=1 Tax=Carnegiea gigantea TaxID=171969 RepID=A0A9Q1GXL2_9CARY|nr:hypothetical protein Cgig2_023912 [Carnegiea gigantea]
MDVDSPLNGAKLKKKLLKKSDVHVQLIVVGILFREKLRLQPSGGTRKSRKINMLKDKGVSSLLEEKWEHIYGRIYATGENVYVPTMQPPIINVEEQAEDHESKNHTKGRLGEEDNLHMYNLQDNPYFQSVLADEDQFFTDFVEYVSNGNDDNTEVNSEDGPSQLNNQLLSTQVANKNLSRRAQKSVLKTNTVQLKHNSRQSGGSAMLGAHIKHMVASY